MPYDYGLGINTIITQQQLHHRREEQFQKRGPRAAFRVLYYLDLAIRCFEEGLFYAE
jgi:hypothetical protein